jgi:alpha-L-arabinofuranosidase
VVRTLVLGYLFKMSRPFKSRRAAALWSALLLLLGTAPLPAQTTATVTVQVNQPGAVVSSNLFGIFFEEINFAGEGGIYAEMVRNRSLKNSANPDFWTLLTNGTATGTMTVDYSQPLNTNKPCSLNLTMSGGKGGLGAANAGFWGMSLQAGATYDLKFYALAAGGDTGSVIVQLQNASGSTVYAQTAFSGLTANWQEFAAPLVSSGTATNARIVLSITNAGTVWLDEVSLFPQATFNTRTNGLRADLANELAALHPSFMRYPGGNFIESDYLTNAVRWKKTIGDTALRPGHENDSWGYWSTDGFGLDEYLQFCQDLGMCPLYGINCGLALGWDGATNNTVPLDEMGPWVQDALDLIQYANGDTNTPWGAVRAANGHPAPYHLQYMEIGNENSGSYYNDRYALFYDAIKSNYPAMHLIANDQGSIPTSAPVEIQDEHYYTSPATFESYATKYDSYSRSGPKVFVGEYAVTADTGTYGSLAGALGEAAFMTGMERNSDLVQLASYAPLFANVNDMQWSPNLINYDSARELFGTPSYYVQEMFGQNRGNAVLPATVVMTTNAAAATTQGAIGVGSWNTSVQYTNIVVSSNGVVLYTSNFAQQGTNGWSVFNGTWSVTNGVYQQSADIVNCYTTTGSTNWSDYTISLSALKTGGAEGFLILFNVLDDNDWTWWNIGGWTDTLDGIEQMVDGNKTTYAQVSQSIAPNTWYNIRIVLTGLRIQCCLGTNSVPATNLVQDVTLPAPVSGGLYVSSTYANAAGQVIIKAANPSGTPLATTFILPGVNSIAPDATVIQLTSGTSADANSLAAPEYVYPVTNTITDAGTNFTLTLPANSLSVLRLTASGINTYTNLTLQFTSPILSGQTATSSVMGELSGAWVSLTANANYALSYASANTNVAVVDLYGNVTGVGYGTTTITASYASLGLTASQLVQVVYVPAALVHRYSFNDAPGSTTVTDSVGGAAWNGTLPNGGTLANGQVALAAASAQYVQLPAGILGNYTSVTMDAWASFGTLPGACFFFGFGNISGSSGEQYIFCQPENGRAAITASNYSGEQNTIPDPSGSWSGLTNLHVTVVFDPPLGYLALYTNAVLAAINSAVTIPFSSVDDLYSFIGRSLYSGDSYFDFSLDEFRIYNGALSANDIAASQVLGPGQVLSTANPILTTAVSGGSLTLSWPVAAPDYTVMTTTNLLNGAWTAAAVTAQIVGNQWQVTLPVSGSVQFYRLQR